METTPFVARGVETILNSETGVLSVMVNSVEVAKTSLTDPGTAAAVFAAVEATYHRLRPQEE